VSLWSHLYSTLLTHRFYNSAENGGAVDPLVQVGRGRRSWAQGLKRKILLEEEPLFHQDHGAYYKRCANRIIEDFGYDLPYDELPAQGVVLVSQPIESFPANEQQAERDRRIEFRKQLEKVSSVLIRLHATDLCPSENWGVGS
jgi:hypothetical protein